MIPDILNTRYTFTHNFHEILAEFSQEIDLNSFHISNFSDGYGMSSFPPGMDPSFLFRSPLLSDAENNNLMAAAAQAEKTRALMMMGAVRPPTGPMMPPPPNFPNYALAAISSGAPSVASTLAAALTTTTASLSAPQLNTISQNRDNLNLISHWSAIHQAALANSLQQQMASEANKRSSPPTGAPPGAPPGAPHPFIPTSTADLRLSRPLFPVMPSMRFSPYIIPTTKSSSPSPPEHSRSSPLDRIRAESTSPTA